MSDGVHACVPIQQTNVDFGKKLGQRICQSVLHMIMEEFHAVGTHRYIAWIMKADKHLNWDI